MKVTRQASAHADAVQWLGTQQSLKEIQSLLWPMSPLFNGDYEGTLQYRSLGVDVSQAAVNNEYRLEHVRPGGWVVRDGNWVEIMLDEQFKKVYAPSGLAPEQSPEPPPPQPAPTVQATHPRALANASLEN